MALIAEVSAAFIPRPCGIESTVMGQDIKGDHFKLAKDVDKDMEDFTPLENQQMNRVTPKY